MVQRSGLHASTSAGAVQPLIGELRSHMPSGQKQKLAKVSFLRIESFTFFVMVLLLLLFKPTLGLP